MKQVLVEQVIPSLMSDVTHILVRIESGDPIAADQLLPLVYDELRKLAAARMLGIRETHSGWAGH